jgi:hypothetical protein
MSLSDWFHLLRGGEMVNSWSRSWQLSTRRVTGSHHTSLRDRPSWEEVSMFNARMNHDIDHRCKWNGYIPYSELESGLHREASSAVAIYWFGPQKTEFIRSFIGHTVDIAQLGCPQLADISLPAISFTFACHTSKHVCALRSASSLAQWLTFTLLVYSKQSDRVSPHIINVFQIWALLRRTYFLNE